MTSDELEKLVGKTGKELADEGYEFSSYYMYGGNETGVQHDKGFFSYAITFDASVPEPDTKDGCASVQDAKVTEAELLNVAESVVDLSKL